MRGRFILLMTLVLALSACGDSSSSNKTASGAKQASDDAATTLPPAKAPITKPPKHVSPRAAAAVADATYVAATGNTKAKAPAVVLLPDTGAKTLAEKEAGRLAQLGVASIVVEGPAAAPKNARAFDDAVTAVRLALAKLRKRPDVDPERIGFIGEGVGAHVGAVVLGHEKGAVPAAVLANIGGEVVPSRVYAPARWLERANGTHLLFQRDSAKRAMTQAEIRRLLLAAPPGTIMQQYKRLGANAQVARDGWIKSQLLAY
ncbi:MAG TPA: hypothetical protein VFN64_13725 [Burkholderiaceae bacterium]|nr:hypothetical protein [Burkholderiaceae bacterium]